MLLTEYISLREWADQMGKKRQWAHFLYKEGRIACEADTPIIQIGKHVYVHKSSKPIYLREPKNEKAL